MRFLSSFFALGLTGFFDDGVLLSGAQIARDSFLEDTVIAPGDLGVSNDGIGPTNTVLARFRVSSTGGLGPNGMRKTGK